MDAGSPFVGARASKLASAFISENSAAFDDLQVDIAEELGAPSEDSLCANGMALNNQAL